MSHPVIFLLGPSGVGKTTLGNALAEHLGLLHILFDGHPAGNGVDAEGLRREWDALLTGRIALPLVAELRRRSHHHTGAVISCPSGIMPAEDGHAEPWHFRRSHLAAMAAEGARCVVLIGPLAACMDAAIHREGTEVTVSSWCRDNACWRGFQRFSFPDCVLDAFDDEAPKPLRERRKSPQALVQEFRQRFLG